MQAAAATGIADFEEHLWLGSLLETFYLFRHERKVRGDLHVAESPENIAEVIERLAPLHLDCSHNRPMRAPSPLSQISLCKFVPMIELVEPGV